VKGTLLPTLTVAAALTGCATQVLNPPPGYLLEDCPEPTVSYKTNGDLARAINDLRGALRLCNDDKAALREHYK
jgi:hypothetical protein